MPPKSVLTSLTPKLYVDSAGTIRVASLHAQIKEAFKLSGNESPISDAHWQEFKNYFDHKASEPVDPADPDPKRVKYRKQKNDPQHNSPYSAVFFKNEPWAILGTFAQGDCGAVHVVVNQQNQLALLKNMAERSGRPAEKVMEEAKAEATIHEYLGDLLGQFNRISRRMTQRDGKTVTVDMAKAYFAVPLADGYNLRAILKALYLLKSDQGALVTERQKGQFLHRVIIAITEALVALHERNVVCCDLKFENVVFDGTLQTCTIVDMGFAKQVPNLEEGFSKTASGTAVYTPPEVLVGLDQTFQQGTLRELKDERGLNYTAARLELALSDSKPTDSGPTDPSFPVTGARDMWALGVSIESILPVFKTALTGLGLYDEYHSIMLELLQPDAKKRPTAQQALSRLQLLERSSLHQPVSESGNDSGIDAYSHGSQGSAGSSGIDMNDPLIDATPHHGINLESLPPQFVFKTENNKLVCHVKPLGQRIKEAVHFGEKFLSDGEWAHLEKGMRLYPEGKKYRKKDSNLKYSALAVRGEPYINLGRFARGGTSDVKLYVNRHGEPLVYKRLKQAKLDPAILYADELEHAPAGSVVDAFVRCSVTQKRGMLREKFGIVSRFIDGYDAVTLLDALVEQKPEITVNPDKQQAIEILIQKLLLSMAQAVAELGAQGEVHTDIKPDNFLWDDGTQTCVLIDRGNLQKVTEGSSSNPWNAFVTPGYIAPELTPFVTPNMRTDQETWFRENGLPQCIRYISDCKTEERVPLTTAVDAFSLGVTLQLFLNDIPFALGQETQNTLATCILGLLHHDPKQRMTAAALVDTLKKAFNLEVSVQAPASPDTRALRTNPAKPSLMQRISSMFSKKARSSGDQFQAEQVNQRRLVPDIKSYPAYLAHFGYPSGSPLGSKRSDDLSVSPKKGQSRLGSR